jgi:hypothetical protein
MAMAAVMAARLARALNRHARSTASPAMIGEIGTV